MDDDALDALLGPIVKHESKLDKLIVTIGAANPTTIVKTTLPIAKAKKNKDDDDDMDNDVRFTQQRRLTHAGVTVTRETEEEKQARLERKRLAVEERARNQATQKDAREEEEERALLEATEFLERVHQQEEAVKRQRQEEFERDYLLQRDGSEKPPTFQVPTLAARGSDEDLLYEGCGADEAAAMRADANLHVSEYYKQGLFPADTLVAFVTRNGRIALNVCELAFVINGCWWRKCRFQNGDELRSFIEKYTPERIEVGPIHPMPGTLGIPHADMSLERTLVFDVDMTPDDAPDAYIRTCPCRGTKNVCSSGCWFYMRVAAQCLTYLMRRCLGCQHIVIMYSGRRGIHAYALDEKFLAFTKKDRAGILARMMLYKEPLRFFHPEHSVYLYEYILKPVFYDNFMDGHRLITTDKAMVTMIQVTGRPARTLPQQAGELMAAIGQAETRRQRMDAWLALCAIMPLSPPQQQQVDNQVTYEMCYIFTVMFPRIDERVTTDMSHCVKAPFVLHPSTKRCSVPIPDIDTWRPYMAPRISEIVPPPKPPEGSPDMWRWKEDERRRHEQGDALTPYVMHFRRMLLEAYPLQPMYSRP